MLRRAERGAEQGIEIAGVGFQCRSRHFRLEGAKLRIVEGAMKDCEKFRLLPVHPR